MKKTPANIDAYIARFPEHVQELLRQMRNIIHTTEPRAEEAIRYDMPAFLLQGRHLVLFAAFRNHIGFYSVPTEHPDFAEDFTAYKTGSGSVQFPLDKPLPEKLIRKIVQFKAGHCERK